MVFGTNQNSNKAMIDTDPRVCQLSFWSDI